jgi:hypothetical protein
LSDDINKESGNYLFFQIFFEVFFEKIKINFLYLYEYKYILSKFSNILTKFVGGEQSGCLEFLLKVGKIKNFDRIEEWGVDITL